MGSTGAVVIKQRLERNVGKDALGNLTQNRWIVLENDIISGPNGDVLPMPQEASLLGKSQVLSSQREARQSLGFRAGTGASLQRQGAHD